MSTKKHQDVRSGYRSDAAALLRKARKSNDPLVMGLLRVHILTKKAYTTKPKSADVNGGPIIQKGRTHSRKNTKVDRYYEYYY